MHPMLSVLLSMLSTPYHAVSKPTIQAWARIKRAKRRIAFRLPLPTAFALRLAGVAGMAGGDGTTAMSEKAVELRERAAAKFKEANEYAEECAKDSGKDINEFEFSEEQLAHFDGIMNEAKELDKQFQKAAEGDERFGTLQERLEYYHSKATGRALPWQMVHQQTIERPKSLGEQLVTSEQYKELLDSGVLKSDQAPFKMHPVIEQKAATDVIHSETGGPGAGLITPVYLPGMLALPQRPLTVRELFGAGQTTGDTISYARQTAFDNAAAAVAQATSPSTGLKPQSSIAWDRVTSPVETIATWMVATRQQLADAGMVQSLIDNQGRLMLQLEEEDQLIAGDGSSPNLQGLATVSGLQTFTVTGDNLDAIRHARKMVATGTSRLKADSVIMNPSDGEEFDLLKDLNGQYRGGNPVGNFTYDQPLWGLRRVESEAVPDGTVYVGAFKAGATVFERQGITVLTTDSHADFFVRNLIVVLFEERLGFAIFYPTAFVKITLATWADGS